MAIEYHKAAGGVAITASHNPIQWNGLKFMGSNGRFLSPAAAEEVYAMADRGEIALKLWQELGSVVIDKEANRRHIEAIKKLSLIDVNAICQRKFKVVVDCVNGAGGLIIPQLLEDFGCEVVSINNEPNGRFAHTPEPLPENLGQLCEKVRKVKADLGFAVDPDVDRCAIVDNTGAPIGEEYTLALAVEFVLRRRLGYVVVNMSTSRASEDIARYYNCIFQRSKVGEINVAEMMVEIESNIGGEGNGGVILPELHTGRDAPVAVALTLQHLLESGKTMQELRAAMPQYFMIKDKIEIAGMNPDQVLQTIIERYKDQPTNLLDGVKIDFDKSWVHLRKSNTEPIVRVISEAPSEAEAKDLVKKFKNEILSLK
jgi:phosphomannomutase